MQGPGELKLKCTRQIETGCDRVGLIRCNELISMNKHVDNSRNSRIT